MNQEPNNNQQSSPTPFIYMAPIRGITDAGFRNIFHHHFGGCDAAIAPFINPQRASLFKKKNLKDILPANNPELPVIPQSLNTSAEDFLALATRLQDLGYQEINWNLGCPAPMVAKKKRGSGILPFPDQIISFLEEVMPRLQMALSIKTRLGFNSLEEGVTLISRLNNFPLKEIILHARLGCQMYRGKTNLEGFATYKQLCQHPIVFNGDITDVATFALLQKRFPDMDRWMIGRGLIATPNLANDIKNNNTTSTTSATSIKSFHDDIYTYYEDILFGPSHLLGKMKQIWEYLITSFPENQQFLKKIRKAKTKPQYEKAIEELFSVV